MTLVAEADQRRIADAITEAERTTSVDEDGVSRGEPIA